VLEHDRGADGTDHVLLSHVLENEGGGLSEGLGAGVDVKLAVGWLIVGVGDAGEVGVEASAGLLLKSLDVSAFTDFEGGADVALKELEAGVLWSCLAMSRSLEYGEMKATKTMTPAMFKSLLTSEMRRMF
jgi:hypothetical protein